MRGCWFCRGGYIYAQGNLAHQSLEERKDGPLCDDCHELVIEFQAFLDSLRPLVAETYLVLMR